uniref:SUMO interacting motifs containing 1 n=1 Tax=Vombatus ursinus TaxID=29139 RepID=A0A4X2JZX5_VOMUR
RLETMGDPIVISDDSDSEWSSDHVLRRRPQATDPNPVPSRCRRVPTPEVSSTSGMMPSPVPFASGLSPEASFAGQDVDLAPGTSRPSHMITLTDNPGKSAALGGSGASSSGHLTQVPSVPGSFYEELFDDSEEQVSADGKPEPIPPSRVQRVINTIEANFPEATVQCLGDLVTPRFYPPREILSHVIREILLSPHVGTLLDETLKLLTKIQELHPASITQVEWDWQLLTFVMQERDKELPGQIFFLRYVLQTMEDDFQEALKHPADKMPATLANAMLSCYKQSGNIRDIITWIIGTLSGPGFPLVDRFPQTAPDTDKARAPRKNNNQIIVLYLQKMLALAVEVDRTPTCSSNKIAEMLFGFVLNIPERDQREAFFTTMENHLLRCKVLEILMLHSCSKPTTLPLSFAQILYFLSNATSMYHQTEDSEWESWDEFLEHLHFLLISYQQVVTDHLRVPMGERKEKSRRLAPQTHPDDDISALDVELQVEEFRGRMARVVGGIMPLQIQEKLFLLKLLFLQH